MQLGCEVLEIIGSAKVGVQAVQVLLPVAMVGFAIAGVLGQVLDDGRNPNLEGLDSDYTRQLSRLTAVNPMPWM